MPDIYDTLVHTPTDIYEGMTFACTHRVSLRQLGEAIERIQTDKLTNDALPTITFHDDERDGKPWSVTVIQPGEEIDWSPYEDDDDMGLSTKGRGFVLNLWAEVYGDAVLTGNYQSDPDNPPLEEKIDYLEGDCGLIMTDNGSIDFRTACNRAAAGDVKTAIILRSALLGGQETDSFITEGMWARICAGS